MKLIQRLGTAATLSLLIATPAFAQSGAMLSEPSDLSLLTLGLVGVVLGQRAARKRA
ncbi:MAG: hypothetical protein JSS36_02990 [Proteobacteria bacterium]|nr:hypothetical protein [Pseudomonadota bacterium]